MTLQLLLPFDFSMTSTIFRHSLKKDLKVKKTILTQMNGLIFSFFDGTIK